jgi:hypothetical protein
LQVFALNRDFAIQTFFCHRSHVSVAPVFLFVSLALLVVIPALSRDPVHAGVICKRHWCTLVPGSAPGMTKSLRDVSTSLGRIKWVKKMGMGVQG